jgi:hypothetical protein
MTIITQYKGRTTNDAGVYYAPYLPNMINPFTKKWERVGKTMPTNKWVYNIRSQEIKDWIEQQPIHMWKHYDIPESVVKDVSVSALLGPNYIFTEEMEAWFQLRWS